MKLFVYGTLRVGAKNSLENDPRVKLLEDQDCISGYLYDLGWYPGVKEAKDFNDNDSIVFGNTFEILDESIIPHLDSYEGYPHLYGKADVKTMKGHDVFVYTYNHPVFEEPLMTGDWLMNLEMQGGMNALN